MTLTWGAALVAAALVCIVDFTGRQLEARRLSGPRRPFRVRRRGALVSASRWLVLVGGATLLVAAASKVNTVVGILILGGGFSIVSALSRPLGIGLAHVFSVVYVYYGAWVQRVAYCAVAFLAAAWLFRRWGIDLPTGVQVAGAVLIGLASGLRSTPASLVVSLPALGAGNGTLTSFAVPVMVGHALEVAGSLPMRARSRTLASDKTVSQDLLEQTLQARSGGILPTWFPYWLGNVLRWTVGSAPWWGIGLLAVIGLLSEQPSVAHVVALVAVGFWLLKVVTYLWPQWFTEAPAARDVLTVTLSGGGLLVLAGGLAGRDAIRAIWPNGWVSSGIVTGFLLVAGLVTLVLNSVATTPRTARGVRWSFLLVIPMLLLPFVMEGQILLLAGLGPEPDPPLVAAGAAIIAMDGFITAAMKSGRLYYPEITVASILRRNAVGRDLIWESYLDTELARRPDRPRLDLVRWMSVLSLRMSRGDSIYRFGPGSIRPGQDIDALTDVREATRQGLDSARRRAEALGIMGEPLKEAIQLESAWADLAEARALLTAGIPDRSAAAANDARLQFETRGMPLTALLAGLARADALDAADRSPEAEAERQRVAESEEPSLVLLAAARALGPRRTGTTNESEWMTRRDRAAAATSPFAGLLAENEAARGGRYPARTRDQLLAFGASLIEWASMKPSGAATGDRRPDGPNPISPYQEFVDDARRNRLEGNPDGAIRQISLVLPLARRAGQDSVVTELLVERAAALADMPNRDALPRAVQDLGVALEQIERRRLLSVDDTSRIAQGALLETAVDVGIDLFSRPDLGNAASRAADVFALMERARGRVLAELLGDRVVAGLRDAGGGPGAEAAAALAEARRQLSVASDAMRHRRALDDVLQAEKVARNALRQLAAGGDERLAELASIALGEPTTAEDVGRMLRAVDSAPGEGVVVVSFHLSDRALVIVGVSADEEPRMLRIDAPANLVEALERTAKPASDGGPAIPVAQQVDALREALNEHLPTISSWGTQTGTVCLVPGGPLHGAPLNAVFDARTPVVHLPSAGTLRHVSRRPPRRGDLRGLVVAAPATQRPLAYATTQARALAGRLDPLESRLLSGQSATRAQVIDLLTGDRRWDVVHFACHGEYRFDEPLSSGLLLAGQDRLTAEDFLELRLDVDLVTLAACDSGVSRRRPADELIGLTRSLLRAGAGSVLVTLWKVDELSTILLLHEFYDRWTAGASKADALRQAQDAVTRAEAEDILAYAARAADEMREDPAMESVAVRNLADANLRLGLFSSAQMLYTELLATSTPESPDAAALTTLVARCTRAARAVEAGHASGFDPRRRPFQEPYHWAGFTLVGDWR